MPPTRRRTETESIAVVGSLEQFGPLGADNRRRQLGRSVRLVPGRKERETLVYTGASRAEKGGPALGESLAQSAIVTCSKSLDPSRAQQEANPTDLRARIEGVFKWGNDGHQAEARFDWLEGTTLRGSGAFFQVDAELVDELDGEPPTSSVKVGAFVGYGQPLRAAQLTRRIVTDDETPVAAFDVPLFARQFTAWWSGASCVVDFLSGGTTLYTSFSLTIGSKGIPLTLPGGVTQVRLNGSTFGPTLMVWHLDI